MRVAIIGAGFAGLAAANGFRSHGHQVVVFEKSTGPSTAGGAISLAQNALTCLSMLGVRHRLDTHRWADVAATVRTAGGRVLVRSSLAQLTGGREYATVPRGEVLGWLTDQLPAEVLRYSTTVVGVGTDGSVRTGDGEDRFDLVVGADGANGVVRRTLWSDAPAPRCTDTVDWAWIVEEELSTGFGPIWGRTAQFGVLPLTGKRTYVYGGTCARDATLGSFRHWPSPLPELIDAADPERIVTPTIVEARPPRQLVRGKVILIGDAAHAMQPTFGQGAALAMEDALILAHNGTAALSRRFPRMFALYGMSKAGAYFAAPRLAVLEMLRNAALRATPDAMFGLMAGSVSHWSPAATVSGPPAPG